MDAEQHDMSMQLKGIVLLFVIIVSYLFWIRYLNGLGGIPGPFLASLSSFWKWYVVWKEEMPWRNAALHEKYGPLVRIGPKHVSASSLEALHAVHIHKKGFQKSAMYEILQPQLDKAPLHNVFSTRNVEYHSALKRTIGGLYNMSTVTEVEPNIDRSIQTFISRLEDITNLQSATVDMSAWLQFWTFDTIGEIDFSQPIGFLEAGADIDGICERDHEMMLYYAVWGQVPNIEKFASRWLWNKALKPNRLYTWTVDLVKSRLDHPTESKDMLNSLLHLHKTDPDRLSLREVTGAAYINLVTAHDVLAIALRAIMYYVCRDQSVYRKLNEEILQAERLGNLSEPSKYVEVVLLPYLSAVINEALRIHPSTGTIFERDVPPEGILLHGKRIPTGTVIGVNAWVMNRNKGVFGEDVERFRPERWIDNSEEKIRLMKKNLLTFGAGARSCIGKNIAMMQLLKVIVELYRHFDIELADPKKEWHISGGWLTRQTQMDMVLTKKLQRA
ncbi:cytochrome P450 oxidoreductase [Viridothelium virens]|uniref:Cytochrome P450 oxidoreductase n=1 Tax=Viridothelium virens TaxID=1048519 RepID=A0A6A6H3G8_VIRVR|nr:cytochrome P450 oxidoreductase [Viridothelium virens]